MPTRGNIKPEKHPKFPLLISYAYLRDAQYTLDWLIEITRELDVELFLDSGAFTAFNSGREIELDEYIGFLKEHHSMFFGYMQLDKLQDPAVSAANLREMKRAGLKPIPIHVFGDDQKRMDELFELSDVVALGGFRRPHRGAAPKNYVVEKMRWAAGRNVHWLGYTNLKMVQSLTPFSCDCSSFTQGVRYGNLSFYLGGGTWKLVSRGEKAKEVVTSKMNELLESAGYSEADFYNDECWTGNNIGLKVNALSWIRYILDVRKRFGTRVFLASTLSKVEVDTFNRLIRNEMSC